MGHTGNNSCPRGHAEGRVYGLHVFGHHALALEPFEGGDGRRVLPRGVVRSEPVQHLRGTFQFFNQQARNLMLHISGKT